MRDTITTDVDHTIGSGRIMTPTNKLRFVNRKAEYSAYGIAILQQWWENINTVNFGWTGEIPVAPDTGEWRDVPIEKENSK